MPDISRQLEAIRHEQEEGKTEQIAQAQGLPYIGLINYPIAPETLRIVPKDDAISHRVASFLKVGKRVNVATDQLNHAGITQYLQGLAQRSKFSFVLHFCSPTSLKRTLLLYDMFKAEEERKQITKRKGVTDFAQIIQTIDDVAKQLPKVSTTELLDLLTTAAVKLEASDIHLEPEQGDCRLRFRLDGVLEDVGRLNPEQYRALNSRIKNLAELKLDIRDKPQDGRFSTKVMELDVDIRVATLPASYGEDIVMRLLVPARQLTTLKDLGFSDQVLELVADAIGKPHGMILNTGPTGSGKTTTLYAIVSELNKPGVKIITIEDPIEYRLKGIDQTQVEPEKGYSFVSALRSALRQDPDIVMVGEIRDSETAKIALNAALTGHLVLSTLHTNNAAGAIPRMLEMGIEPFLLAGSINLIVAQRLVRRLCPYCKGKKCLRCRKLGYRGRIAVAEALKPTTEFNQLIARKATIEEFETKAKELGMTTMLEDGLSKVAQGLTTKEEVERVTRE